MSKFKKKNEKKDEKTDTWLEAVATSKEKTDDDIRAEAADKASSAVPLLTKSAHGGLPVCSSSSSTRWTWFWIFGIFPYCSNLLRYFLICLNVGIFPVGIELAETNLPLHWAPRLSKITTYIVVC